MKIRTLEWDDYPFRYLSSDMGNQVLYDISRSFDIDLHTPVYSMKFFHGYVTDSTSANNIIGHYFTIDSAKQAAQQHFEHFVKEKFFIRDS